MLPDHWHRRLVDSGVRRLTDADLKWANIAMLSGMLVHKAELIEILESCRHAGLRTVIGGPVTSSVEELPNYADHVVVGEAEGLARATRKAHGRHNGEGRQARGVDTYLGVVLLDPLSGSGGVLLDAGTPYHCAQATDCNHPIGCWAGICHAFVSAALFLRR